VIDDSKLKLYRD